MARYGALTALQAALMGISGGAQGMVQAREREQKEAERVKQAEREAAREALENARFDLEKERSQAEKSYREAQLRQQADELLQREKLSAEDIASRERIAKINAGAQSAERALRQRELDLKRQDLLDDAEAWWNQTVIREDEVGLPMPKERIEAAARAKRTFDRLRIADKKRDARELIAAAYAAEQAYQLQAQRGAAIEASRATAASKPRFNPQAVAPQTAPPFNPGAAVSQTQRKPFIERASELKAKYGDSPEAMARAKAELASEGYDIINMR